jgi:hypothetical protein
MKSNYPRLSADTEGVWRQDKPEGRFGIRWDEVSGVVGHKLDCIDTIDTVLELEFEYGEFLELNSTWSGFDGVVASITSHMPFLGENWFSRIEGLGPRDRPIVIWRKKT